MATKNDIEVDITLEIDGDLPTPNQLAMAITSFSALINNAQKELESNKAIQWGIQVKKGSNLIGYVPSVAVNPQALVMVANGLRQFEDSHTRPAGFTEVMLFNLQNLCEVTKNNKKQNIKVNIWLNKELIVLSQNIKKNINKALEGTFIEYGFVEGLLQTLDSHKGYQFAIYEPLYNKKIICNVENDEVFTQAYSLYEKRVEAEGLIKYSREGLPCEIKVEKISALIPDTGVPDYRLTRGILKQYV